MMLKTRFVSVFCLALFGGVIINAFAHPPGPSTVVRRPTCKDDCDRTADPIAIQGNDYQTDVDRLIALRSRPLDELIALAAQLEAKWRRVDWNQYARIMRHVCSEISNRDLNNERIREQSEHFARLALSQSSMYLWEHESALVEWLGYQRLSSNANAWLRERREKTELWLHALQRLEKQTDPSFDINDRKNQPSMRVYPPFETGLPAGTPPSAIKDPLVRAKYEAMIVENKKKSERVDQQLPLLLHGPSFKKRAERWLIQAYSQSPDRSAELKRYLEAYVQDATTRERILDEVMKNPK